jgi:hypothetical protein
MAMRDTLKKVGQGLKPSMPPKPAPRDTSTSDGAPAPAPPPQAASDGVASDLTIQFTAPPPTAPILSPVPAPDPAPAPTFPPAPAPAPAAASSPAIAPPSSAPPLTAASSVGPAAEQRSAPTAHAGQDTVDLKRRKAQLTARVAELQFDLGGLVYEMAIRDRIRVDVIVKRAALLQDADAELAEVDRILRLEETSTAGTCANCGAPHSSGAAFCWQCGQPLLQQVPHHAIT